MADLVKDIFDLAAKLDGVAAARVLSRSAHEAAEVSEFFERHAQHKRALVLGALKIITAAVEKDHPSEMRIDASDGAVLRSMLEQAPPAVLVAVAGVDVQNGKATFGQHRRGYVNLDHAVEMTLYGEKFSFPVSKSDADRIKAGMDKVQATWATVDGLQKQLAEAEADAKFLLRRDAVSVGPAAAKVA